MAVKRMFVVLVQYRWWAPFCQLLLALALVAFAYAVLGDIDADSQVRWQTGAVALALWALCGFCAGAVITRLALLKAQHSSQKTGWLQWLKRGFYRLLMAITLLSLAAALFLTLRFLRFWL